MQDEECEDDGHDGVQRGDGDDYAGGRVSKEPIENDGAGYTEQGCSYGPPYSGEVIQLDGPKLKKKKKIDWQ